MKEESITLFFREGSSDKVYQAELKQEGDGWNVHFAYGRRGAAMTTGKKFPVAAGYNIAKKEYDKLVKSKQTKGYTEDNSGKAFQGPSVRTKAIPA